MRQLIPMLIHVDQLSRNQLPRDQLSGAQFWGAQLSRYHHNVHEIVNLCFVYTLLLYLEKLVQSNNTL